MGIGRAFFVERKVGGQWQSVPPPTGERWWNSYHHTDFYYLLCGGECYHRGHNVPAPFQCIAPARGLPSDLSAQVAEEAECDSCKWGATHYTLAELLAFDWDAEIIVREQLCPAEYVRLLEAGDRIVQDCDELQQYVARVGQDVARNRVFGHEDIASGIVHYRDTYRGQCGNFFADLPHIQAAGNPDEVRIIAWWTE